MGCCCCCCRPPNAYLLNPSLEQSRYQFEALQLSEREVSKLYRIFRKVDVDGSGQIELIELLVHIDIERTAFSERVFGIFDEDGSGEIDFREFVLALWNYCTLSRATLDLFAFDLYDRDSSGLLSVEEIEKMCKDIYGRNFKSNAQARAIVQELNNGKLDDDTGVDIDAFRHFARTHQALLFPAFLMQELLQKKVLGKKWWAANADRRIELSKGKFIPIAKFMEIHLDKALYNQVVEAGDKNNVNRKALAIVEHTGTHAKRKEAATGEHLDTYLGLQTVTKASHGHHKKGKVAPVTTLPPIDDTHGDTHGVGFKSRVLPPIEQHNTHGHGHGHHGAKKSSNDKKDSHSPKKHDKKHLHTPTIKETKAKLRRKSFEAQDLTSGRVQDMLHDKKMNTCTGTGKMSADFYPPLSSLEGVEGHGNNDKRLERRADKRRSTVANILF